MKKILFLLSVLICLVACQKPQEQSFIGTDIGSVSMNTTFKLHDFNGHIRTLEDFKGKVVLLLNDTNEHVKPVSWRKKINYFSLKLVINPSQSLSSRSVSNRTPLVNL